MLKVEINKGKRCVSDIRHINSRIAKTNLAFPLVRDMLSMIGSSKYEILLVINLENDFHSMRCTEESKKYCRMLPYFGRASYLYQKMQMGLNISPAI